MNRVEVRAHGTWTGSDLLPQEVTLGRIPNVGEQIIGRSGTFLVAQVAHVVGGRTRVYIYPDPRF